MVPSGLGLKDELKSKFSLYLLSQLMYGVVIVLERQTAYLESKSFMEYWKRIIMAPYY